jgi:hypothetical protein
MEQSFVLIAMPQEPWEGRKNRDWVVAVEDFLEYPHG